METRDFKLLRGENGTLQMQLQWAQGGGRTLAGAALNFYGPTGTASGHAHMTIAEVKEIYAHMTKVLEEYGEI